MDLFPLFTVTVDTVASNSDYLQIRHQVGVWISSRDMGRAMSAARLAQVCPHTVAVP